MLLGKSNKRPRSTQIYVAEGCNTLNTLSADIKGSQTAGSFEGSEITKILF